MKLDPAILRDLQRTVAAMEKHAERASAVSWHDASALALQGIADRLAAAVNVAYARERKEAATAAGLEVAP